MRVPATLRSALLLFACVASLAFSAKAAESSISDPLDRLYHSQSVVQKLEYSGTFVYQQGSQVRTSRITRLRTTKSVIEKLEVLDGQSQEYVRNGEEIIHYFPAERRIVVEHRGSERSFPDISFTNPREILRYYTARQLGMDRVAGRDVLGFALEPRDGLRYGYRFWSDRASGLLLRAQTLSEKGEIIEQIAFTQLSIGKVRPSQVKTSHANTRGWRIENSSAADKEPSGWNAGWLPGGFKPVRTVKRVLGRPENAGEPREVVQLVFSDGLAGISVFIEAWSPRHESLPVQQGSLNMLGKRHGKFWLTIVGEVPLATIRQVAESLEFAASDPN
ncbi:RseB Negative regulator of sigma E activity [Oxalobacteraceae bacterium]